MSVILQILILMEKSNNIPKIIKGAFALDQRGKVSFCNDFNFKNVKRFYFIENSSTDIIRAFHGHLKEEKYMLVISGKALISAVHLDNPQNPDKNNEVFRFVLSSQEPSVLHIPGGFANGMKFLEEGTKLIVFSTATLEDSKNDDYRFSEDYWGKEIWEIKEK